MKSGETQTNQERQRDDMARCGRKEDATRSVGVSERDFLEEHDEEEHEDEEGGPVIFQQCSAQNFNGHRGCGKSGAGRMTGRV